LFFLHFEKSTFPFCQLNKKKISSLEEYMKSAGFKDKAKDFLKKSIFTSQNLPPPPPPLPIEQNS
jgi:hypothetical protein